LVPPPPPSSSSGLRNRARRFKRRPKLGSETSRTVAKAQGFHTRSGFPPCITSTGFFLTTFIGTLVRFLVRH
ncbi:hypothetical protein GYMLUDRAFT_228590, partial [Collybiopsis luxurians FD-317 M1]